MDVTLTRIRTTKKIYKIPKKISPPDGRHTLNIYFDETEIVPM